MTRHHAAYWCTTHVAARRILELLGDGEDLGIRLHHDGRVLINCKPPPEVSTDTNTLPLTLTLHPQVRGVRAAPMWVAANDGCVWAVEYLDWYTTRVLPLLRLVLRLEADIREIAWPTET